MGRVEFAEYRLTQENFAKSVKLQKKFKKRLDTWASEFKPFVDRIVAEAIHPFQDIQMRMDHGGANQQKAGFNVHSRPGKVHGRV